MLAYTIRRFLLAIPVIVGISMIIWFLAISNPDGGPTAALLGRGFGKIIKPEQIQALLHANGLDKPLPVQYIDWLGRFIRGNWGQSYYQHEPVTQAIGERIIPTLILGGTALILEELFAIPLGIYSAVRRGTLFDQVFSVLAYVFYSLPTFWFGLMAIVFFGVILQWVPFIGITGNVQTAFGTPEYWAYFHANTIPAILDIAHHLILPASILALVGLAANSRFLRGQMLEVLNQDYVRTARAKGLPQRTVILKHAARNALLPLVTNIGLELPLLIGGAVVTESIFSWPGMGRLYVESATIGDFPVVIAIAVMLGILVVIFNILTDLAYAVIDPRIRYS